MIGEHHELARNIEGGTYHRTGRSEFDSLGAVMNRLRRMMEDLQRKSDLEAMKTEIQEDITELRRDIKDITDTGLQTSRALTSMR